MRCIAIIFDYGTVFFILFRLAVHVDAFLHRAAISRRCGVTDNTQVWGGIRVDSFYDDLGYRPLKVKTNTDTSNQQEREQQHSLSCDASINSHVNDDDNNSNNNSNNTSTLREQWDSSSSTLLFQGTIQGNSLVTIRLGENS